MAAVIVAVRVPTSTLTVPDGTWAGVRSRTSDSGASFNKVPATDNQHGCQNIAIRLYTHNDFGKQ